MRFLKPLRLLATFAIALGLVLHLTIADRSGILRAVFYGLPWPVLAMAWLALALMWRQQIRVAGVCVALAAACFSWWVSTSYRKVSPPTYSACAPRLKVLSWNMAHEKLPSADLQKFLEIDKPDIAGLVEVGVRHSDPGPLVTALPAGYTAQKLDNALAIAVRGTVRVIKQDSITDGGISKYASLEAVVDGITWRVFIVDGASGPVSSREKILDRVLNEARSHPHTIVLGDFNTPVESALFNPWRADFEHAFTKAGHGFRETWPRQLPVLTIDHIWCKGVTGTLRAEKRWLSSSDHAALLAELAP